MNPYNFSILCFGFCSLLLGLLVWLKRQDAIGNGYFGVSLCYAGWAIFIAINLNNDVSPAVGLFMGRLGNGCALFIPAFWYHFICLYTGQEQRRQAIIKSLYVMVGAIGLFIFSPWFIPKVVPMVGFKYYSQAGPIYYLHTITFLSVIPLSFYEIYRKIGVVEGHEKQQLKGLLWTALVGYIGGAPTFLPIYGIPFPQYALFLLPIYPFALAYFMIKHRIFDMEELAQVAHRDKLMAMGMMAASMNHEIKNPLYIIRLVADSQLEKIKKRETPEQARIDGAEEGFKKTLNQVERIANVMQTFSLLARPKPLFKIKPIRLRMTIDHLLSFVQYEIVGNTIQVVKEIPEDLEVVADGQSVEEVLLNLMMNAAQAMKKGGTLTIKAAQVRDRVQIEIRDEGPGIPPEAIGRIFEPFYTTKESGTGLGLCIVKQLVERSLGRIEVASQCGKGTVFTVSFPMGK